MTWGSILCLFSNTLLASNLAFLCLSVNFWRTFALKAFFNNDNLKIFLITVKYSFLVEISSFFDADLKETRCFFRYNVLTLFKWSGKMTDFLPFRRSNNVPVTSNFFNTLLKVEIEGKFLLWKPGRCRNDRLTTVRDPDKIHSLIACFFWSKVNIVTTTKQIRNLKKDPINTKCSYFSSMIAISVGIPVKALWNLRC